MFDHSLRKANLSLLVFMVVLVGGLVLIGGNPRDVEHQAVVLVAFASAFTTLFWLYHREDRARDRAERRDR
jgi:hypothetical protein